jgi:transcriptional regulator with XRE-family HTH domain
MSILQSKTGSWSQKSVFSPFLLTRFYCIMSHRQRAKGIHVLPNTVSTWTKNVKQPSWEKLYAIADFLNIDVRELLVPNGKSPKKDVKL